MFDLAMKIQTPARIRKVFFFSLNTRAMLGDEKFGVSIGRFYVGYYGNKKKLQSVLGWFNKEVVPYGWACGFLSKNGFL
jgi:hypothetical protein